jgi:hypothetical protein
MQVTANARCRKIVVGSLARPTVEKRRSLNWDARPSAECISKKAAPPVSPIASDKLSEAEATSSEPETAIGPGLNASTGCIADAYMRYACAW